MICPSSAPKKPLTRRRINEELNNNRNSSFPIHLLISSRIAECKSIFISFLLCPLTISSESKSLSDMWSFCGGFDNSVLELDYIFNNGSHVKLSDSREQLDKAIVEGIPKFQNSSRTLQSFVL